MSEFHSYRTYFFNGCTVNSNVVPTQTVHNIGCSDGDLFSFFLVFF